MSRGIDWGLGRTNVDAETGIRFGVIPAHDLGAAWWDTAETIYGAPCCPKCGNEVGDDLEAAEQAYIDRQKFDGDVDDNGEALEPELSALTPHSCADYGCARCGVYFGSDESSGNDEPLGFKVDDSEYFASQGGDDHDIFIERSPYFTCGAFCSPCAPGAVYLPSAYGESSADNRGARAYCFGHDWFWDSRDNYGRRYPCAPYPVYLVSDGSEVYPPGLTF